MVRTIWLAAVCMAVIGALTAGKVFTTAATPTIQETPADGATIDAGLAQEPFAKADRLQITNVHQEASTESVSQPIKSVASDVPNSISPEETIIVNRHWHDSSDTNYATAKSKQFGPTRLPGKVNPPPIPEADRLQIMPSQARRPSLAIGPALDTF